MLTYSWSGGCWLQSVDCGDDGGGGGADNGCARVVAKGVEFSERLLPSVSGLSVVEWVEEGDTDGTEIKDVRFILIG